MAVMIFCFACGKEVKNTKCGCQSVDINEWSIDDPDQNDSDWQNDMKVYPSNHFFINPREDLVIYYEPDRSIVICEA